MNVRGIDRGALAPGVFLVLNAVGLLSGVIVPTAIAAATGYLMGVAATATEESYVIVLSLTMLMAVALPVLEGLMTVCWAASLIIAIVILVRRCAGEPASSVERLFWWIVGGFGMSLMIGLLFFHGLPRPNSEPLKESEMGYGGPPHYLFVSGVLVCSLLGAVRPRARPPALPNQSPVM